MTFKQKIVEGFLQLLNEKIDSFQFALDQLSISVMNETKSTAGDKHETALSMLQAEQSRMAQHLYDAVDNKSIFLQIDLSKPADRIAMGSLVKTDSGYFFISVALPKIEVDGISVIAVSKGSPLGKILMGLQTGDVAEVNTKRYCIEQII